MSTLERPYGNRKRPGHHAARVNKGHPRRQARRDRAAARKEATAMPTRQTFGFSYKPGDPL